MQRTLSVHAHALLSVHTKEHVDVNAKCVLYVMELVVVRFLEHGQTCWFMVSYADHIDDLSV